MPFADPKKSFEIAVRHLFRHLDDTVQLRRNPLVIWAFGCRKNGKPLTSQEISAVIRSELMRAGRLCYAKDVLRAGI